MYAFIVSIGILNCHFENQAGIKCCQKVLDACEYLSFSLSIFEMRFCLTFH